MGLTSYQLIQLNNTLLKGEGRGIQYGVGILRRLIGTINTGKVWQFTPSRFLVQTLGVSRLGSSQGGVHKHLDKFTFIKQKESIFKNFAAKIKLFKKVKASVLITSK